jgi:hypothetical protein
MAFVNKCTAVAKRGTHVRLLYYKKNGMVKVAAGVEMAMGKYPPGINTPYSYLRHKNSLIGSSIYTGEYEFTLIPIPMWVWVTHRVIRTHKN